MTLWYVTERFVRVPVRELHEEVLQAPQHGRADVPGPRLLQVFEAARVQADSAESPPRVARRHRHPVQRGACPAETGHVHTQGREEQLEDCPRGRRGTPACTEVDRRPCQLAYNLSGME